MWGLRGSAGERLMGTRIEGKVVTLTNAVRFCDVCGAECNGYAQLIELLPDYQTDEIKEICKSCESTINKQNGKLLSWALKLRVTWCKDFIHALKAKKGAA